MTFNGSRVFDCAMYVTMSDWWRELSAKEAAAIVSLLDMAARAKQRGESLDREQMLLESARAEAVRRSSELADEVLTKIGQWERSGGGWDVAEMASFINSLILYSTDVTHRLALQTPLPPPPPQEQP